MRLILASASPRRAELLASAGYVFDVVPGDVDETPRDGEAPESYASRVAAEKAAAVFARCGQPGDVVLGADTVVVQAGEMLMKPSDPADAGRMLRRLSGVTHSVYTGVTAQTAAGVWSATEATRVQFLALSDEEIEWYVASGEPMGKAGGYAIQGRAARFVCSIAGSWSNVVGLPISAVHQLFKTVANSIDPRSKCGIF